MVSSNVYLNDDFAKTVLSEENIDEKNLKEITVEQKVEELKELILSNQFDGEKNTFHIDGLRVKVKVSFEECLLAYKNNKQNVLDRFRSLNKKCFCYYITVIDSDNSIFSQEVLIKDKNSNKFYKYVYKNNNGEYDLCGIKDNELVCYSAPNVASLKSKEEYITKPITSEVIKKQSDAILETKIKQQITEAELSLNLGIQLFKNNEIIKAEEQFLKVLSINNEDILKKANYYLGRIYLAKKQPIIAENYLRESLKFDNKDYPVLLELGKVLSIQKRYNEAINCFDNCWEKGLYYTEHIVEKGKAFINQGEYLNAIAQFDLAIFKHPNKYSAHLEKGKLLYELNNYDAAKEELSICDDINPKSVLHKSTLGKIKYLEGQIEEAIRLFNECVQYNIKRNTVYFIVDIAYFFHQLGEKELAYEYYLKVPKFRIKANISDEDVENHIKKHTRPMLEKDIHSIFNFPVSIDILRGLIQDMEKTSTTSMYDVYQIYCKNAGYILIDETNKQTLDYITILTLPFTKKVRVSYPSLRLQNVNIDWQIELDELISYTQSQNETNLNDEEDLLKFIDDLLDEMALTSIDSQDNEINSTSKPKVKSIY